MCWLLVFDLYFKNSWSRLVNAISITSHVIYTAGPLNDAYNIQQFPCMSKQPKCDMIAFSKKPFICITVLKIQNIIFATNL